MKRRNWMYNVNLPRIIGLWIASLLAGLLVGCIFFASLQLGEINRNLQIMTAQNAEAAALVQSVVGGSQE
jgi:uncharacterized membrane protein (UPF0136 family)